MPIPSPVPQVTVVMAPIPAGWFNIVGPGTPGVCMSAKHSNGRLVQESCSSNSDVLWQAEAYGSGFIVKSKNGRVMDNNRQKGNNGNGILGYQRNNTAAQIWAIESVGNGTHVRFRNLQRNKCVDDYGKHLVGIKYELWTCRMTNQNQWFRLTPFAVAPVIQTIPMPIPSPVPQVTVQIPVPAPTALPLPTPIAIPSTSPYQLWANSYSIAYFQATPGVIEMETLRN